MKRHHQYSEDICANCGGTYGLHNHMNKRCPKNINADKDHTEYRDTVFAESPSPGEGEAVAFVEWVDDKNYWRTEQGAWMTNRAGDDKEYTTAELYQLFPGKVSKEVGEYEDPDNGWVWVAMFYSSLKELVELKDIKDHLGKTDDYEQRQPLAWESARLTINLWHKTGEGANKVPIPAPPAAGEKMRDALEKIANLSPSNIGNRNLYIQKLQSIAREALSQPPGNDEWVKVEEDGDMPKPGYQIMAFNGFSHQIYLGTYLNGKWIFHGQERGNITHWRYLPTPPMPVEAKLSKH